MGKHTKCLICDSADLKHLKTYYDKHGLVKCKKCGFVFIDKIPTEEELQDCYSEYSYKEEEQLSSITMINYHKLLNEFEEYRKTNKILEVGCGRGWFLYEARKRGWNIYGTEYSDTAVKLCEDLEIEMRKGALNPEQFSFSDFDIIVSSEVLEHINYNPNEEINNIYKLLRPGGLFYCTTPNFNSLLRYYKKENCRIIAYPEHLSYYTKTTLNFLLRKNNFKLKKFLCTGINFRNVKVSFLNNKPCETIMTGEDLRSRINKKVYLKIIKNILNKILTITNTGATLKGYYVKQNQNNS